MRLARASSARKVSRAAPEATATACGVRSTCASKSSCTQASAASPLAVSFHSTSRRRRSSSPSIGISATARVRVARDPVEQRREVPEHPLDGRAVEEIGAVLDGDAQRAALHRAHDEGQVVLDRRAEELHGARREAWQARRRDGRALHREDDLEERGAARIRLGRDLLHEALERHVLVGIGAETDLSRAVEERREGGVVVDLDAQHERVDEEADQPLGLGPAPVRDGGAHHDVALPRPAVEQDVERGEEGHEERHALAPAELREPPRDLFRQDADPLRAAVRRDRRPRAIRGQVDDARRAVELRLPVRRLAIDHVAREPPALPGGEVRVLDRELGEDRAVARGEGGVERADLAAQDVAGHAVQTRRGAA